MTPHDRILRDPSICGGEPVIRGTRVLVRVILGYLARGESAETICREFPSLSEADVQAVRSLSPGSVERRERKGAKAEESDSATLFEQNGPDDEVSDE